MLVQLYLLISTFEDIVQMQHFKHSKLCDKNTSEYPNRNSMSTKEAHKDDIVHNHYIAQFEEDNVDLVIWIHCINHVEKRKATMSHNQGQ